MVSKKVKIINPSGLHLRTATVLSNSVLKYNARLQFAYEKNNVKGGCKPEEHSKHCGGRRGTGAGDRDHQRGS